MKTNNTQAGLRQRIAHYKRLLALACEASLMLEGDMQDVVYEAHIQSSKNHESPVMREGPSLQLAVEDAKRVWRELHPGYEFRKQVEVFVRRGDVRVAIDPDDLGEGFMLDTRVANFPNQMAFDLGDKLPSAHYAVIQTKMVPA